MPSRFARMALLALFTSTAGAAPLDGEEATGKTEQPTAEAQRKVGRKLLTQYRAAYRKFTREVVRTKSKSTAERVRVFQKSTKAINELLEPHVKTEAIAQVLPELAKAQGINLTPTLSATALHNSDREIRALATYTLAVHLHNTGRDEKRAIALLKYVGKKFDKIKFENHTLAAAARVKLHAIQHLSPGKPAPDVAGEDADGAKFRLSDYRGKVIVLRFWGDWCPFCRSMFPQERELVKNLADKPFVLLGVNSDSRKRLKQSQQRNNLVWRSFWDGGDTEGPIAIAYQVTDWPTIYVIDHKGRIRHVGEGVKGGRAKWLDPVLKKLIAEAERDLAK